jgi:hypothetical protein
MAIFDKSETKRIVEFFEELGYPVQFINVNDEKKTYNKFVTPYPNNLDYKEYFYESPITIKGVEKNDEYNIYFTSEMSVYDFQDIFYVEDGKLKTREFSQGWRKKETKNILELEVVSKGTTFLDDVEFDVAEYQNANEFANFENFDSIDAPDYSVIYGDDPQVSVASPILNIEELTASQIRKAEEKLQQSKKALADLIEADKKGDISSAMWTFDEVDELYNAKISADDKRAFFIYLQNKTRKKLTGDFDAKYGSAYPAEANTILELMKKGCLFYDPTAKLGERLQPKVIYQSGNIWKKWGSLTNKKDEYIKRFGQTIYDLHVSTLEPTWVEINTTRLSVRGDKDMRLILIPISSLADDIKISGIISPKDKATIQENFRVYTSFKKGELVEDYLNDFGSSNNYINKKVISLQEGFILWCKQAGRGQQAQENGIQWSAITTGLEELLDYYIKPKSNPFSKEKGGEDKWARYQDDAKKVGERLFAQFLAEGLTPEDQLKVEYIWNSIYNSYREPNLDEVPIGFTYKKYHKDIALFILRDSNLRAIRYYLTRGSIGLAYGVGLGKTFCSIFTMKQALDLGIVKRPLVIVPNQVYFQFGREIRDGLGEDFNPTKANTRLNMFYNGSDNNNVLGNNAVDGINLCTYEATENFQFAKENLDLTWVEEAVNIIEMGGEIKNEPIVEGFLDAHKKGLFNEITIESDLDMSDEYETPPSGSNATEDDFELEDSFDGGGKVGGGKKKKPIQPIIINSESTNFDMVVVDEAHNFNNLFTSVVSEPKKIQTGKEDKKSGKIKIQREKNPYNKIRETSGGKDSSSRAEKLWFLARYIQYYNKMGNTILLSATPFTNSPLQIYSMLSFLNYDILYDAELGILKDFFDTFAKIEYAEDFRTDLSIVKRNKFIGWTNVISLQKFVYRVFDKSSPAEEDKAVVRPNKWTLPLKRQMIEGKLVEFAKENFISTTIRMSDLQLELWKNVRLYAQGELRYEELFAPEKRNTTSLGKYVDKTAKKATTNEAEDGSAEVDVENTDDLADGTREEQKSKASAKALQCLMWGRQIALNPYLFKGSGFKKEPTGREYVEASPKLLYVMECIKSIKNFHEQNPDAKFYNPDQKRWVGGMSGQVIYMNFGTKAFELLRDYLVDELGFDIDEIGIIRGDANFIGKKRYDSKQKVAQAFMGQEYDEASGKTTFLEDSKRLKVLIGSESIKEGINLQDYSSALYNCFLDFNPTDQVQVEGRIWRQGNAFANVRIVTPLMADCIDVFMFQKLEDKTERINQIWTKNGNRNELDTTAFNPAELKYELLTDPVAIAVLEREYKRDKLEEQKTQEGEMLSSYLAISAIFKKSLEIKYKRLNSSIQKDFYFAMYYNISQVRPDLIDKPLVNQEGYLVYAETILNNVLTDSWKERRSIYTLEAFLQKYPNLYAFVDEMYNLPYGSQYNLNEENFSNPLWRMQFDKLFNYNAEQLIELMVQVLKEQKIGYPLGYSKNWRELIPEKPLPIVEGDEVEFDTKKGRKKGFAELVVNDDGDNILNVFFTTMQRLFNAETTAKPRIEQALDELKISADILKSNSLESLSAKEKNDLSNLLKWMYQNDSINMIRDSSDGRIFSAFTPVSLDVDELEDLKIVDRNIVLVEKGDKAKKKVEPTKYPEPFVYSNKDRNENIKDIADYLGTIVYPKLNQGRRDYKNYVIDFVTKQPSEQIPMFSDEITSMPQILGGSANDYDAQDLKTYVTTYLSSNWAELVEKWKDSEYGGMFNMYRTRFYNTELPLTLAEFKRTEEKKIKPLGINNFQDVENLILAQKEKINTLSLEQKNLDDEQVFEELVQEVMRRQQELNSDEIRAGSSFKGRADLFANPNSDYLGNNMLAIFRNSDVQQLAEVQEKVEKQMKEIAPTTKTTLVEEEEQEEVVIVAKDEKAETQALISDLEELLEFSEESEKAETQSLIDDLKELLEFM